MACVFAPKSEVRTNELYFQKTQRRVRGTVIEPRTEIGEKSTIVQWDHQEGNVDPRLTGVKVLMANIYLELDV